MAIDDDEASTRSHWEPHSKWPGLVMVAVIVAVLVAIWLIGRATRGGHTLSDDLGPQVTSYLSSVDAPEASFVVGYRDRSGKVLIETTLADTSDSRRRAQGLCEKLAAHTFDKDPTFVVVASTGADLMTCQ
jgi:hypothetical protein